MTEAIVAGALALLVPAIIQTVFVVRRQQLARQLASWSQPIEVIAVRHLRGGHRLALVMIGGERMLLGCSAEGSRLLHILRH